MKSHSFQIELLGGPVDGLQLAAQQAPSRTIRMPSSPAPWPGAGFGKPRAGRRHWAMYELLWRRCDIDARGAVVVRLGYDFVGCRARHDTRPTKRFAARLLGIVGPPVARLRRLMNRAGGWRRRLVVRSSAAGRLAARKKIAAALPSGGHDTRFAVVEKRHRLRHP
jgi:hypothetical protein